jgi:predicted AlkP superfamily phosphohydrolase/phosphomutase
MARVVGIGLDAAEWWLVEQLVDEGRMPNLRRLMDRGASARLSNVREYRSELPWTLFWTGRPASENGYWSTIRFDPSNYDVYECGAYGGDPFWRELPDGVVATFDVPHIPIFPDRADAQVTAWGAHSPQYARASQPRGMLTELEQRYGTHPAFDQDHEACWFDAEHLRAMTADLLVGAERRTRIVEDIARGSDWQLLLTVMGEPHSIGHHGWHGVLDDHPAAGHDGAAAAGEHVREVYAAMDESIGRIGAAAPDANLVVFALHGMQANTNELTSFVVLPELLHRAHFGQASLSQAPPRRRPNDLRVPADYHTWAMEVIRLKAESRGDKVRRDMRVAMPEGVMELKHHLMQRLGRHVPSRPAYGSTPIETESMEPWDVLADRRVECNWQPPCWWSGHWTEMPWFAIPTYSDGHIRINLEGRERDGVVARDDYDKVCEDLAAQLNKLTNASNGKPAIEDISFVRRDDPMDPDGPSADVVVIWSEPAFTFEHPELGQIGPLPYRRTGEHSSNGFVVAGGADVPHVDLGHHAAADLPPTILGLLGQSVPADVAGTDLLGHTRELV